MWGCLGHIISSFTTQTLLPRAWLIALTSPSLFSLFKVTLRMLSLYFLMKLLVKNGIWQVCGQNCPAVVGRADLVSWAGRWTDKQIKSSVNTQDDSTANSLPLTDSNRLFQDIEWLLLTEYWSVSLFKRPQKLKLLCKTSQISTHVLVELSLLHPHPNPWLSQDGDPTASRSSQIKRLPWQKELNGTQIFFQFSLAWGQGSRTEVSEEERQECPMEAPGVLPAQWRITEEVDYLPVKPWASTAVVEITSPWRRLRLSKLHISPIFQYLDKDSLKGENKFFTLFSLAII